jgi:endonuclease/exonuclease/phosphatase (EEP) superfamily protein YafD
MTAAGFAQFAVMNAVIFLNEDLMIARIANTAVAVSVLVTACLPATAHAQDVPGIEICTVEKTMERRTSCLQSNVDFLQKTINKLTSDHQQKLDAANRQVEGLKGSVITLQKIVDDLQKKVADDQKKKSDTPPAKDAAPVVKDGAK